MIALTISETYVVKIVLLMAAPSHREQIMLPANIEITTIDSGYHSLLTKQNMSGGQLIFPRGSMRNWDCWDQYAALSSAQY